MPLIPPPVVSSASDYHSLSLPSVQNSATSSVPVNATINNSSSNDNVNDVLHINLINNNSSNTVMSNNNNSSNDTNGNGQNLIGNSTLRDGDSNGNIVNEEIANVSCNSPLVTSLPCNILTSHESTMTASAPAVNGNAPCICK